MDFDLIQVIKKEKEDNKDYCVITDNERPLFTIDVHIEKQKSYEPCDLNYNSLITLSEVSCLYCCKIFKNRYLLLQHHPIHMKVKLTRHDVNDLIRRSHSTIKTCTNKQLITKRMHKCNFCDRVMPYKAWFSHEKEVHGEGNFICNECNMVFKCKSYLRKHIRNRHNCGNKTSNKTSKNTSNKKKQDLTCTICNKVSKTAATLHCHMKNVHSAISFECDICGSKLKSYSYYLVHLRRVHYNDGKNHQCNICNKQFKSPRYVSIHKKNSHRPNVKQVKIKNKVQQPSTSP